MRAAPKVDNLDQALRNAGIVLEERARLLTIARTHSRVSVLPPKTPIALLILERTDCQASFAAVARNEYPGLRAAAVDQLDARQAVVVHALQALRAAPTPARKPAPPSSPSTYAEDWARTLAGMRRPANGAGKSIGAEANMLRTATSQRRAQVDHALEHLTDLDADKAAKVR